MLPTYQNGQMIDMKKKKLFSYVLTFLDFRVANLNVIIKRFYNAVGT